MKNLIKARAIIIKDDKIFLTKDTGSGKYRTPGGTLDEGESIKETLYREIKEELGIVPLIDKLLGFREYVNQEGNITLQFLFLVQNDDDFLSIDNSKCSHGFEWIEAGFYNLEELRKSGANMSDDLEEMYESAIWGYEYNSLI